MQVKKTRRRLYIIIIAVLVSVILLLPREDRFLRAIGLKNIVPKIKLGLDLLGGTSLTYEADLKDTPQADRQKAIDGVINVINKRVNPTGTSEVVVQQSGENRLLVQLPGVTDAKAAADQIGRTAQLSFFEVKGEEQTPVLSDVTGKDLDNAVADIDPQSAQPIIRFEMKGGDSTKKFADLTSRINQGGGRLAIVLDNQILFNGGVSTPITDGRGQMTGFESVETAKQTAVLLNAGALPVPIELSSQRTIGATLGVESVAKSLLAGMIGVLAVMIFMILSYRWAGLIASSALLIYIVFNIAIFKFSSVTPWPIVLTVAGIAGFILSIGMAVDANILIFERMKEELRLGKAVEVALHTGFARAWDSIRDSNTSTLITCIILYSFGAPIIKGFAVTLALGVIVSMLTAITVSKTFLQLFTQSRFGQLPQRYSGVKLMIESEEKAK
ncbi:protein translocase subunit SecD [Candidatus Saccharibacteria bacterium]|nr:protein translocase subunit SecD [Candidatus Saccharibacteria bacterium]